MTVNIADKKTFEICHGEPNPPGERLKSADSVADQANNQTSNSQTRTQSSIRKLSGDPLIGTVIDGRFRIEELLGIGGTSVVYKAKQLCVNRYVAIKTLKFQVGDRPALWERFQREINSLITLNHPNIVTIYDCVKDADDQPFIVMDYLRGRSLDRLLLEEGSLSLEKFLPVILQILSAVDHAHKKGIVHRDLKPGNIVLVDDEMNFVKVVDFGLAKLSEENRKITRSGELWGSPPYMSPEQCIGEQVDERSDIYSLGAVMFEMLSGREPFVAGSVYELIQKHLLASPPPIATCNPEISIPPHLEKVVFKALAKNPENRYQSIEELRVAVLNACSADVNRDFGAPVAAIESYPGSFDDLLTYANAMAPYVVCSSPRPFESVSATSRGALADEIGSDTLCDAQRLDLSQITLPTGFWTTILLFVITLLAAGFYVVGTVDGIRANAENYAGSGAGGHSERPNGADLPVVQRLPGNRGLTPQQLFTGKDLRESTQRSGTLVREAQRVLETATGKRAGTSRAFVKQSRARIVSQKRKEASTPSRDPWDTLDSLRTSRHGAPSTLGRKPQ